MNAKTGITEGILKRKVENAGGVYEIVYEKQMQEDFKGVEFDCENVTEPDDEEGFSMPGFKHGYDVLPNGVPVCWVGAGGDWEDPLAFCMFIGEDGEFHAYIPKDGNAYNFKLNRAFGNWYDEEQDSGRWEGVPESDDLVAAQNEYEGYHLEELKFFGLAYKFDMEKMREEAAKCISFGPLDEREKI